MLLYCTYQYIYNSQCLLKKTVELNFKKNANDLFFLFLQVRERERTFDMLFHKKGRKEKEKEEGITRQGLGRI